MGQKVNPNGFRYGITKKHKVNWYASKNTYATFLLEDQKIYKFFKNKIRDWQIGQVNITRNHKNEVNVTIFSASPGKILGQGGENIKKMKINIQKFVKNKKLNLSIQIELIEKPELNAKLVAEDIAIRLENRGNFRISQKFAIRNAFRAGAKGIKTSVAGRLNGVDMARTEGYTKGEMKLHTLRQNVDYASTNAYTTYGIIGIKVWISMGEYKVGDK